VHAIRRAETDADIARCHAVMAELRPQVGAESFVARVRRQAASGYELAFLEADGRVAAVAGFRISECLAWGRFLYVDDLVTAAAVRSSGCGGALLDWLVDEARRRGCAELHLDSGVQRFGAHRFYLGKRLDITSHHFARRL
jgi:GNAT superfamily N-acetyltransferase